MGISPGHKFELLVEEEDQSERLDQWIADELGDEVSRSRIQKWIKEGAVQGEGIVKASRIIKEGELYIVTVPRPQEPNFTPADLNLNIIYEDDDLAVVVKPAGIAVHPGPNDASITMINALLYRWSEIKDTGEKTRPGIVHRLDKPTEGLLVVAKNPKSHRILSKQFQERTVYKEYAAWLTASPREPQGAIHAPISRDPIDRLKMRVDPRGRLASTDYMVEKNINSKRGRKFAFVNIRIHTGRTHQIRVHFAHIGTPIVGDVQYSRNHAAFTKFGLLLFSRKLRFTHPETGKEMSFQLDLPQRFIDFEKIADQL